MKRVILAVPEGLTIEQLTPEQQVAINGVFGQFVFMPGTVAAGGKRVVDAVAGDNFDPAAITELGLPFEVLTLQQFLGEKLSVITPMDEQGFMQYLPEVEGEAKVFRIPHHWAGWPT